MSPPNSPPLGPPGTGVSEEDAHLRGASALLAGRAVSVILGLLTQVLLVRALTKEDFGAFAFGLSVVVTARIVVSLGHNRTISRFLALYRERGDHARLLGTLVMEAGMMVVLGSALAVLVNLLVVVEGVPSIDRKSMAVLGVLILLAPLEALDELFESTFAAFGRVGPIVLRQHVIVPVLRLGVVLTLMLTGAGVWFVAGAYVLVMLTGVLWYAAMLRRLLTSAGVRRPPDGVRFPVREVFSYSFPLLSNELVYVCTQTVGFVALGVWSGPLAVAALRAVVPLADAALLVRRQFHRLFLPLAATLYERRELVALRGAYWRSAAWVTILTFPVFLLTVPLGDWFTVLLLGERYAGSATYLVVLASAAFVNAALGFNAEVLQAAARVRWLVVVNFTAVAAYVVVLLALVERLEALGVALATAAAVLVQNVGNQIGLRTVLGGLGPPGRVLLVYAVVVLTGSAVLVAHRVAEVPLYASLGLSVLSGVLVIAVGRRVVRLTDAFPGLGRVPVLRRLC